MTRKKTKKRKSKKPKNTYKLGCKSISMPKRTQDLKRILANAQTGNFTAKHSHQRSHLPKSKQSSDVNVKIEEQKSGKLGTKILVSDSFGGNQPHIESLQETRRKEQDTRTQIQQQFDNIIAACHHVELTACKTFADILEAFPEAHKKHKTLRNLPKIMIRLYRGGSLDVSEEELRKFYQLPSKRRQEIVFILYLIQDLLPTEIAEKVNFGDENLSTNQKRQKIENLALGHVPSKRKIYTGVTDRNRVTITHPHLVNEVHPTENGDKKLADYSYGSPEPLVWLCPKEACGYKWTAPINQRTSSGTGCPACAGRVVTDRNRVTITHPHLVNEVHPTENGDRKLADYSYGSSEPFVWLCPKADCGHKWIAPISSRTSSGTGCPACAGRVVTDRNRVIITHPHLVNEIHPTENGDRKLADYSYGSSEPFVWLCPKADCGHKWTASIDQRTSSGTGCPACAGRVVTDRNRVTITHPHLVNEVHPTENGDKKLADYSYGSPESFMWLCPEEACGYKWTAPINQRTSSGTGCPA
ncbi:MAG: zinc-ribbon domain-containing protein, partial [Promethearchaeota archaeon]